ncbi:MAG: SIS domain-containing protein [Thermoguttaceae bacterium]
MESCMRAAEQPEKSTDRLRLAAGSHLRGAAEVCCRLADHDVDCLLSAARLLAATLQAGGKVLLCGNGGSAADCQHLAAEFVGRLSKDHERGALAAIALTTDTSILTAIGNDYGFDAVFRRQVEAFGRPGDLLIGISTSGNSPNVIGAIHAAKTIPMRTIALTGQGGAMATMVDVAISVPSANAQHVQESHLVIEHILCDLAEQLLFAGSSPEPRS